MAVSATDVPSKYDLVYTVGANTYGHVFDRTRESTIYASRARAEYGYTPTFLERTNVGVAYGDDQQAFFLTASQNDWSLGEGQKVFRLDDGDSKRKVWLASAVDTSIPGKVTLAYATQSVTFGAAPIATCESTFNQVVYASSITKLYSMGGGGGTASDLGVHGVGNTPNINGMAADHQNVFITSPGAGSVGIRKWNGAAFSTFSATTCDSLTFMNNTLYGVQVSTGKLFSFDTAGTATTQFQWKNADGSAATLATTVPLVPYGGKLLIANANELWVFDGTSTSLLAQFPIGFVARRMAVVDGIVVIAGGTQRYANNFGGVKPTVYYYANGTFGKLWQSESWSDGSGIAGTYGWSYACSSQDGVLFTDGISGRILLFNPALGSITGVGTFPTGNQPQLGANQYFSVAAVGTTSYLYPQDTTKASSGFVASSLVDFGTSLTKSFRGIKVDYSPATDGDGGSIDVSYQVDSLDGSYTSLQTGVTTGTEYLFSNVTGRSISIKVTLNKGTSTLGPTLKRVYVRAAPTLQSYRTRTYNLDLTSTPNNPTFLNDGSTSPLTGHEQATALISAITSSTALTIVDRFGSYTGVFEPDKSTVLEIHSDSGGGVPANSGQFIATVFAREV